MEHQEYLGYKLFLFPYDRVDKGEDIILYGFGKVGKQYYWQVRSGNYCKIKYITDRNFQNIEVNGIDTISPDNIEGLSRYKVVLSVQNGHDEIIASLIDKGWKKENIIFSSESVILPVCRDNSYTVSDEMRISRDEYAGLKGSKALDYLETIKNKLRIFKPSESREEHEFVRVGRPNDGGYIMLDIFGASTDKVAYSFGIADDVSWDSDMADRGYSIYMYDHTIDELPCSRDEFHFFRKGISDTAYPKDELETLGNLIKINGHDKCKEMILKMDVEGAEYGFINNTKSDIFDKFEQIVMEFHDLLSDEEREARIKALDKLLITHVPVHIHANNLGDVLFLDDEAFADCIEVTYINRKRHGEFSVAEGSVPYIKGLDEPCWREKEEVIL